MTSLLFDGWIDVTSDAAREIRLCLSRMRSCEVMCVLLDGLDRLTSADRGDLNGGRTAITTLAFAQAFDLDQLNNWAGFTEDADGDATLDLDQDRTHNDANEITDVTETTGPAWTTPAHDAAGNMTSVPQPAAPTSSYTLTWDAWNRLVKVADGANTVAEYEYDGMNRRIVKRVYASGSHEHDEHFYLSERDQVLEVRHDSSTNAARQFTWGERYVDDLVLRTRDTDANGTLDETLYALQDAGWNITAVADTSGTIVERFKYDPYGRSTVLDANFATDGDGVSDYAWEYRFTSREWDAETGLHYFRARYYHDGLGRFIGRDPLGNVDGGSLYAGYFTPNQTDPSGMFLGMVTYGKYCGWSQRGPGAPKDDLDRACQDHDNCLGPLSKGMNPCMWLVCNSPLCAEARRMLNTGCKTKYSIPVAGKSLGDCLANAAIIATLACPSSLGGIGRFATKGLDSIL